MKKEIVEELLYSCINKFEKRVNRILAHLLQMLLKGQRPHIEDHRDLDINSHTSWHLRIYHLNH